MAISFSQSCFNPLQKLLLSVLLLSPTKLHVIWADDEIVIKTIPYRSDQCFITYLQIQEVYSEAYKTSQIKLFAKLVYPFSERTPFQMFFWGSKYTSEWYILPMHIAIFIYCHNILQAKLSFPIYLQNKNITKGKICDNILIYQVLENTFLQLYHQYRFCYFFFIT